MGNKPKKMSRRERERRMIEEMESAMYGGKVRSMHAQAEDTDETDGARETQQAQETKETSAPVREKQPTTKAKQKKSNEKTMHCPRCRTVMENGKCPTCGHYVYVPMSNEKRSKIRLIVGGVCVIGFVILFVIMQLK